MKSIRFTDREFLILKQSLKDYRENFEDYDNEDEIIQSIIKEIDILLEKLIESERSLL